jgi:hypothetical protein
MISEVYVMSPRSVFGLLAAAGEVETISVAAWPHHAAIRRLKVTLEGFDGPVARSVASTTFVASPNTGQFSAAIAKAIRELLVSGYLRAEASSPCRTLHVGSEWRDAHRQLMDKLPRREQRAVAQVGRWWAAASSTESNMSRNGASATSSETSDCGIPNALQPPG